MEQTYNFVFFYNIFGTLKALRKDPVILVKLAYYILTWALLLYNNSQSCGFQTKV